jgi:hypothetical protein
MNGLMRLDSGISFRDLTQASSADAGPWRRQVLCHSSCTVTGCMKAHPGRRHTGKGNKGKGEGKNSKEEIEAKQDTRFRHFVGAAPEWGRCVIATSLGAEIKAFKRDGATSAWEEDEDAIDDEVAVDFSLGLALTEEYLQVDSAAAPPASSQHRQHP